MRLLLPQTLRGAGEAPPGRALGLRLLKAQEPRQESVGHSAPNPSALRVRSIVGSSSMIGYAVFQRTARSPEVRRPLALLGRPGGAETSPGRAWISQAQALRLPPPRANAPGSRLGAGVTRDFAQLKPSGPRLSLGSLRKLCRSSAALGKRAAAWPVLQRPLGGIRGRYGQQLPARVCDSDAPSPQVRPLFYLSLSDLFLGVCWITGALLYSTETKTAASQEVACYNLQAVGQVRGLLPLGGGWVSCSDCWGRGALSGLCLGLGGRDACLEVLCKT